MQLSIIEAAKYVNKSVPTLYRKIKAGELSATNARDGGKVIDVSELIRVFGELSTPIDNTVIRTVLCHENPVDPPNSQGEVSILNARIDMLERLLEDSRQERASAKVREDRLLALLETKLITDQKTGREEKPRRWWSWGKAA